MSLSLSSWFVIGVLSSRVTLQGSKALGLKLLRKIERPEYKCNIAILGYAEEDKITILKLTYNYGVTEYTKGNPYAQIAVGTDDVYKRAEVVDLVTKELGGKITRQPGPIPGLNTKLPLSWTQMVGKLSWWTMRTSSRNCSKQERPCLVGVSG